MFGIYAEITPPTATLNAINANIARSPAIMATLQQRGMTRLGQRAVAVLRVEPAPRDTTGITRLMTPRQRRAFFATNGFGGGIPHIRTHGVSQGWKYKVEAQSNGGDFVIYNDNPVADYVEGFQQQPFLAALGWLYAPPLLAGYSEEAEAITIQNFQTAFDPFAGIPV